MINKIGKLFFLVAVTSTFAASVLFANNGSVERSLSVYAVGDSGSLLNIISSKRDDVLPKALFEDNEIEFGFLYSHNFQSAQWLYFDANLATIVTSGEVIEVDSTGATPIVQTVYRYSLPRIKGKLGMSGTLDPISLQNFYFYASVDMIGLLQTLAVEDHDFYLDDIEYGAPMELGIGYTFDFGTAGNLTLGADLEFSVAPYTYAYAYYDPTVSLMSGEVNRGIDLLDLNISYNVPFAKYLGYTTKVAFRFEGAGAMNDAYIMLEDDSGEEVATSINQMFGVQIIAPEYNATTGEEISPGVYSYAGDHLAFKQNFVASFAIRWDNTLSVNVNDFDMYATFRTQFDNLISDIQIINPIDKSDKYKFTQDLSLELHFILGASYTFNF